MFSRERIPHGVFTGRIGGEPVVVEFEVIADDEPFRNAGKPLDREASFAGEYFYRASGLGIVLAGRRDADGSFTLHETGLQVLTYTGPVWKVRLQGERLIGTWRADVRSRVLRIALTRIGSAARKAGGDPAGNAALYDDELVRASPLRGPEREVAPGRAYREVTDPRFSVQAIELTRFPNRRAFVAANAILLADFDQSRIEAAGCSTPARYFPSNPFSQSARVAFFSASALSIATWIDYDCGAYPERDFLPVTLDLRNGTKVDWNRAIVDRASLIRAYRQRAAKRLRSGALGPWMRSNCLAIYIDPSAFPTDDIEYEIVPTGLLVSYALAHVVASCDVTAVLPSALARPLLAPAARALLP